MPTSSAPELELSLISFAGSGSTATWQGGDKSKRRWRRGGGGRLLEGGDYFKHFGLWRRLFEGRLLFEDFFISESIESWLSMLILSHSNWPEGYIMVRKDRAGSPIGGGDAIICWNDWKGKELNISVFKWFLECFPAFPELLTSNMMLITNQGVVRTWAVALV